RILLPGYGALNQVGQETVQLSSAMGGASETSTAEDPRVHTKIFSILLSEHVRSHLAGSEQAMLGVVNAHRLIDTMFGIGMILLDFISGIQLNQRQVVRGIAVYFVRAG